MSRKVIATEKAPKAIGPYSQAIVAPAGELLFCSGQIPIDPATGELVSQDVVAQAEQVMKNLAAVLEAGGSSFAKVIRTTIYLTDLGNFAKVNELYGRYFPAEPPARATVQVCALPKGSQVEIDAIAMR